MTEIGINGLSNYMEILPASRAVCIDGLWHWEAWAQWIK